MVPDDSEEALIDGLVRSAFQVMGVLTRIGAEHDLSSPSCACSASCVTDALA